MVGLVSLASLLLTGCVNVQTNIALHAQEQWHGIAAIQISKDFVQLMEQGNTSPTQTTEGGTITSQFSADTQGLDEWKARVQELDQREDLNVTFEEEKAEDGSLSYIVEGDGQQYAGLNEVFFEGKADISVADVNGQRQVTIRYQPPADATGQAAAPGGSQQPPSQQDLEMMKAFGLGVTYRISGGQIINSNATRVEGNTAIWEFPTTIEITLTEAPEFSPETIALSAPPPSTGFSPEMMQALAEGMAENAEAADPGSTQSGEATTETTTETSATATESTVTETEGSAGAAPQSPDTPAAAPSGESQNLPASGGILPAQAQTAPAVLASLVLVALVSAGAVTSLSRR
jgi:hypothetical protein